VATELKLISALFCL